MDFMDTLYKTRFYNSVNYGRKNYFGGYDHIEFDVITKTLIIITNMILLFKCTVNKNTMINISTRLLDI